eukprot:7331380-Prymnesium_polylepis.1
MGAPRREGAAEAASSEEKADPCRERPQGYTLFWMLFRTVWDTQKNVNSSSGYPPLESRAVRRQRVKQNPLTR